jgi:serine/threonine protein phosphatase PrpC
MFIKEEYPHFVVEIDWEQELTKHGDDYVKVFDINKNIIFIIVADGVTGCTSGRVASVYISKYLMECLNENIKSARAQDKEIYLEKIFPKALMCSIEKLKKLHSKILFFKEFDAIKKNTQNIIEELKDLKDHIVKSALLNMLISDVNSELRAHELFRRAIEHIDKLEKLVKALQNSGKTQKINRYNERMEKIKRDIAELATYYSYYSYDSKSFAKGVELLFNELDTLMKDLEEELKSVFIEFEKIIKSSFENKKDTDKFYLKIRGNIDQSQPSEINFATTFALLAIEEKNMLTNLPFIKVTTLCYGDTEINIVRKASIEVFSKRPYERILTSFISSKEGACGSSNFVVRYINEGLAIIVSTDGAKVYYSRPQGFPGVIFTNKLNQWIEQRKSVQGFSKDWIDFLKKENALDDDASLVVIRILPKNSTRALR